MADNYLPIAEAFAQYTSLADIDKDYPGIFDGKHAAHIRTSEDGNWLLRDKKGEREATSRRLTADEMRAYMRGGKK